MLTRADVQVYVTGQINTAQHIDVLKAAVDDLYDKGWTYVCPALAEAYRIERNGSVDFERSLKTRRRLIRASDAFMPIGTDDDDAFPYEVGYASLHGVPFAQHLGSLEHILDDLNDHNHLGDDW